MASQDQIALRLSEPYEKTISNLLEKCNEEISRLEGELVQQHLIKAQLERSYASLRRDTSVLGRIPPEVLAHIFLEVVNDDSMAIGPILFVCRKWTNVACSTSRLWNKITYKVQPSPNQINRLTSYVRKAVEYSGSLPLEVTITLMPVRDLWSEMATRLYSAPSWIRSGKDSSYSPSLEHSKLVLWLKDLTNTYTYSDYPPHLYRDCPPFQTISNALGDHIRAFHEINETSVEGIFSLTIHFDSSEACEWYNDEEGTFAPYVRGNPERLSLVDRNVDGSYLPGQPYDHLNPKLKYLSWRAAYSPEGILAREGQLVDLRIFWRLRDDYDEPSWAKFPSSKFTQNLRRLYLHLHPNLSNEPIDQRKDFTFPFLEDLALSGSFDKAIIKGFGAPRLECLRLVSANIIGRLIMESVSQFTSIEKLHLTDHELSVEDILNVFPGIKELGILGEDEVKVKKCLYETRRSDISIKGYRYSDENFWTFDLPYEDNEVVVEGSSL